MAVEKDADKLRSILNANLAERCNEMPQLFARLAGNDLTNKEALDQARSISDRAFSKSADDEISRVRRPLAHHVE
jgi:hypothetical protein